MPFDLKTSGYWTALAGRLKPDTGLFIDGDFVEARGGGRFATVNPATDAVLAEVARGGAADIDRAVASARRAFRTAPWARIPPRARMEVLYRFADLIEAHAEAFAVLDAQDMGKPIAEMLTIDVPGSLACFRFMAEAADKITGSTTATGEQALHYILRQPLGVVGCIVPWNYPLMMAAWKIAPALAAGNAVVLKPAEQSPLSALLLGRLFVEAGHLIVDLAKRYYEQNDTTVLPRSIATFDAFKNAMTLDIAMGGSTNTVLHLLAAASEGEVDFDMSDIDQLSRHVPVLCKVAPAKDDVHMEDVHRAGGIMAILGELDRAGLLDTSVPTVHAETLGHALDRWDVKRTNAASVHDFYRAAPGGVPTQTAFSQDRRFDAVDLDRETGVIRDIDHAYSKDGGLAVLFGNIALDGCIVKTAGVDDSILTFKGPARIFESQDAAVSGILGGKVSAGDVVLIRYEGPRGGPGMQEMLYPTSYLKSKGLGKTCALVTDGRFSGGSSGLSIGHVSPEAAEGGAIGLVEEGDIIEIDIPGRRIHLAVDDDTLAARRAAQEAKGWKPAEPRSRKVSKALQAYAMLTTSAAQGAVRRIPAAD